MSVKVSSVGPTRPANLHMTNANFWTFERKIELKMYSMEEYDSMSMAQHQQLYKLWIIARLIKRKRTPKRRKALKARVAMIKKHTTVTMRANLWMKSTKLVTEIIQSLMVREAALDRVIQTLEG